jgi:NTE family protein
LLLVTQALFCDVYPGDGALRDLLWKEFLSLGTSRPRIALVLGGGGARGLSHIGVLKALKEKNIPIDIIVGTSAGALVGGLYASGIDISELENIGRSAGWNDVSNFSTFHLFGLLTTESLLSTRKLEDYLQKQIGKKRFDQLKIPFACIACDIKTGERIVFKEGDLALAIRASSTIPGVFSPVEYRHRFLVDGGVVDNLPVDIAKVMGADFIIAVYPKAVSSEFEVTNVLTTLIQVINIQGGLLVSEQLARADFIIVPNVKNVSAIELHRSVECIEAGVVAARSLTDTIKDDILKKYIDRVALQR